MSNSSAWRASALTLLVLLYGSEVRVNAQDVTEVTLKGAFIFNFARFTEWPVEALPPYSAVSACVVGDRAVGEALTKTVATQRLNGRPVAVSILEPGTALPVCHVLYVSSIARDQMTEIVLAAREAPILTVGDNEVFTRIGGIVQVFVENGKMRFRINPRSAKRARLQLSSRLLALAQLVDVEPRQPAFVGPSSQAR